MHRFWEWLKNFPGIGEEKAADLKRPVWKRLNVLMIVAAGGILLIVLANTFAPEIGKTGGDPVAPAEKQAGTAPVDNSANEFVQQENLLAQKLEQVLTQIEGVGQVEVTVNLASTPEKDYAVNTTTNNKTTKENDQKGGNRTITETDETGQMVLLRDNQGSKELPVVVKERKPEVKGVVLVADGAADPEIRSELMKAVQVYLDIPLYKVIVLSREGR